ncbi:TlpA family protein disulfide reductase [Streptacidiphilus monticola]|uniref:TlpA family protein disulfide reductase n=1 Tax=Streptacidiphilus monticola TaxID=2161674 RepID=A0ABW1G0V7_9ACTN
MSRPAFRVSAALAAAAAAALALTACSGSGSGSSSSDTHFVSGTGTSATVPVKDRGAAISLSGQDLDGKPLSLADYRGKVVVLNVWGSWCGPCRAEAGDLESVFKATQAEGVQFVGINTRDLQVPAAKAFVSAHGLTYPNLYDPDGELLLKFPKGSLNPQAIPSTLILDREGRVAVRALQPLTSEQLTKLLQPVLAEKS